MSKRHAIAAAAILVLGAATAGRAGTPLTGAVLSPRPEEVNPHYALVHLATSATGAPPEFAAYVLPPGAAPGYTNAAAVVFPKRCADGWLLHVRGWPAALTGTLDLVVRAKTPAETRDVRFARALALARRRIDVALVIDDSHSMRSTDPEHLRVAAAKLFAAIAATRRDVSTVCIVAFNQHARLLLPPTPPADGDAIDRALNGLAARGSTDMDEALGEAYRALYPLPASEKIAIVLSDGRDEPGDYLGTHASYLAKHWPIYTIGLSELADRQTLRTIANATGGEFFFAPDQDELASIFRQIALTIHRDVSVLEWPLADGNSRNVPIDDTISSVTFALTHEGRENRVTLHSPEGREFVLPRSRPPHGLLEQFNPARGTWTAAATGTGTGRDTLSVTATSTLELIPFPVLGTVTGASPFEIGCVLVDGNTPVTGATARATLGAAEATLYDDGKHGDTAANDGIYGGLLLPGVQGGALTCTLSATGLTRARLPFERGTRLTVTAVTPEHPEFWVHPAAIALDIYPGADDTFTLKAGGSPGLAITLQPPPLPDGLTLRPVLEAPTKIPFDGPVETTLRVATAPGTAPARFELPIRVTAANETRTVALTVNVRAPTVTVIPERIDLGELTPGETRDAPITVRLSPAGLLPVAIAASGTLAPRGLPPRGTLTGGAETNWSCRITVPAGSAPGLLMGTLTFDWGWDRCEVAVVGRVPKPEPTPPPPAMVTPPAVTTEEPDKRGPSATATNPAVVATVPPTQPTRQPAGVNEPPPPAGAAPVPTVKPPLIPHRVAAAASQWLRYLIILLLVLLLLYMLWRLMSSRMHHMVKYFLASVLVHLLLFMLTMHILIETRVVELEQLAPTLAVKVHAIEEATGFEIVPPAPRISRAEHESTTDVEREAAVADSSSSDAAATARAEAQARESEPGLADMPRQSPQPMSTAEARSKAELEAEALREKLAVQEKRQEREAREEAERAIEAAVAEQAATAEAREALEQRPVDATDTARAVEPAPLASASADRPELAEAAAATEHAAASPTAPSPSVDAASVPAKTAAKLVMVDQARLDMELARSAATANDESPDRPRERPELPAETATSETPAPAIAPARAQTDAELVQTADETRKAAGAPAPEAAAEPRPAVAVKQVEAAATDPAAARRITAARAKAVAKGAPARLAAESSLEPAAASAVRSAELPNAAAAPTRGGAATGIAELMRAAKGAAPRAVEPSESLAVSAKVAEGTPAPDSAAGAGAVDVARTEVAGGKAARELDTTVALPRVSVGDAGGARAAEATLATGMRVGTVAAGAVAMSLGGDRAKADAGRAVPVVDEGLRSIAKKTAEGEPGSMSDGPRAAASLTPPRAAPTEFAEGGPAMAAAARPATERGGGNGPVTAALAGPAPAPRAGGHALPVADATEGVSTKRGTAPARELEDAPAIAALKTGGGAGGGAVLPSGSGELTNAVPRAALAVGAETGDSRPSATPRLPGEGRAATSVPSGSAPPSAAAATRAVALDLDTGGKRRPEPSTAPADEVDGAETGERLTARTVGRPPLAGGGSGSASGRAEESTATALAVARPGLGSIAGPVPSVSAPGLGGENARAVALVPAMSSPGVGLGGGAALRALNDSFGKRAPADAPPAVGEPADEIGPAPVKAAGGGVSGGAGDEAAAVSVGMVADVPEGPPAPSALGGVAALPAAPRTIELGRPRAAAAPDVRMHSLKSGLAFSVGNESDGRARATVSLARYGGDWDCSPTAMMFLCHQLSERTGMALEATDRVVSLDSPELLKLPFVYMTGHKDFHFTDAEVRNLRRYLENGGYLWADDSTHFNDETFDRAFRREIRRVLPQGKLEHLDRSFEAMTTGYDLRGGFRGYAIPPGDKYRLDYLEGVRMGDRVAVVYSRNDYGDGLNIDPHTFPLKPSLTDLSPHDMQEGATRMGINMVLYFLTHGGRVESHFLARTSTMLRNLPDESRPSVPEGPAMPLTGVLSPAGWQFEEWGDPAEFSPPVPGGGLTVHFERGAKQKMAMSLQYVPYLKLTPRSVIAMDVQSKLPCGCRLAVGITVEEKYYESEPFYLRPGDNQPFFRMSAKTFKSEDTNWEYRDSLGGNVGCERLTLLIYSPIPGTVTIGNSRLITTTQ